MVLTWTHEQELQKICVTHDKFEFEKQKHINKTQVVSNKVPMLNF